MGGLAADCEWGKQASVAQEIVKEYHAPRALQSRHLLIVFSSYNAFTVYFCIMPKKNKVLQHLAEYNRRSEKAKQKKEAIHEQMRSTSPTPTTEHVHEECRSADPASPSPQPLVNCNHVRLHQKKKKYQYKDCFA